MAKHQVWGNWVKSAEAWRQSLYLQKEGPTLAETSFAAEGSSKEWLWLLTMPYTCKDTGRITSSITKIKVSCMHTMDMLNCQNLWDRVPGAEVFKPLPCWPEAHPQLEDTAFRIALN